MNETQAQSGAPCRVLLVDQVPWSQRLISSELAAAARVNVIAVGHVDVRMLSAVDVDVVLLSFSSVGPDELQLIGDLRSPPSSARIALLTDATDPPTILAARGRGAGAYLVRSDELQLPEAVRLTAAGGVVLSPTAAAAADLMLARALELLAPAKAATQPALTDQKLRVLTLVAAGHSNASIAAQLQIGVNTVKSHVSRLCKLLDQRDRKALIAYAHTNRLFAPAIDDEDWVSPAT